MKALKSIDWKRYGLHLGGIVELDGIALLEWENLPTDTHIDIVLHSYLKQYPALDRSFFSLYLGQLKHILFLLFLWWFLDALLQNISLDFFYYIY